MNMTHKWWLAAALMCLSAVGVQRARAQEAEAVGAVGEASSITPASTTSSALSSRSGSSSQTSSPLPMTRPLDPVTIARVADEAERAYQARDIDQALQGFRTVVELDPVNVQAWLRLGNLHQQAARVDEALSAYQTAIAIAPQGAPQREARGKALLNVALLNVARASRAIDELDAMGLGGFKPARDDTALQVGTQRHRAYRSAKASFDVEAPPAFEPYTVDRWIARTPRTTVRREVARPGVIEPITETPLPPMPSVPTLRGVPAAPAAISK
jgi:tetratricopeptide (TPR) repeat protein